MTPRPLGQLLGIGDPDLPVLDLHLEPHVLVGPREREQGRLEILQLVATDQERPAGGRLEPVIVPLGPAIIDVREVLRRLFQLGQRHARGNKARVTEVDADPDQGKDHQQQPRLLPEHRLPVLSGSHPPTDRVPTGPSHEKSAVPERPGPDSTAPGPF